MKKYGSSLSVRGNEIPKLGCWMELISLHERLYSRPPSYELIAQWTIVDLPKIEDTIVKLGMLYIFCEYADNIIKYNICKGGHKRSHIILREGFYVRLVKCTSATQRLRFMRRSICIQ